MGGEGREGEALCLPIRGMQRKPCMLAHTEWRGSGESYSLVSAAVINRVLIYSPFFFFTYPPISVNTGLLRRSGKILA